MSTNAKATAKAPKPAKFVPPLPRPDETIPALDRTAETIAAHVLADLIDQYLHAKHRHDVIGERVGSFQDIDEWWDFADQLRDLNALLVVGAILCWYDKNPVTRRLTDLLKIRAADRAVIYRGRVYAAVAEPEFAHHSVGATEADYRIMGLMEADLPGFQAAKPDLAEIVNLDEFFGWSRSPESSPAPPPAKSRAAWIPDEDQLAAAWEARESAQERIAAEPAWTVTEQDILRYHYNSRMALHDVIGEEIADIGGRTFADMAIWKGPELRGAIIHDEAGQPKMVEFDSPAPTDTASLFGDELMVPDDVTFNAQPRDKAESKPRGKRQPRGSR